MFQVDAEAVCLAVANAVGVGPLLVATGPGVLVSRWAAGVSLAAFLEDGTTTAGAALAALGEGLRQVSPSLLSACCKC